MFEPRMQYNASHGCKKGYDTDSEGNRKEMKNNKCARQCTTKSGSIMKTSESIYCACKKDNCSYQIKPKSFGILRAYCCISIEIENLFSNFRSALK